MRVDLGYGIALVADELLLGPANRGLQVRRIQDAVTREREKGPDFRVPLRSESACSRSVGDPRTTIAAGE